jgi:tRNA 2-thiouridine synthesizing protein C
MAKSKKILFLNRKPPHSTQACQEAVDAILTCSVFAQDVSLLFIDDGVYQLLDGQDPAQLPVKNAGAAYQALSLYDIRQVHVDMASLEARGIDLDALSIEAIPVARGKISELLEQQDMVLSY